MRLKLKFAILTAGKTQQQLCAETGLSESRLSEIVNGWRNPREKDRAALASALGQPERRLFGKSRL